MKLALFSLFIFLGLISFSQEKPKSVLEVNKMNVVYRGVKNPLTISMPETVSFEASAPGLKKLDEYGNYEMSPGSGLTVDIIMKGTLPNGQIVSDTKTLRIKDIERAIGTINGLGCGEKCILKLSKDELKNGRIDMKFENWLFDWKGSTNDFKITEFKILFNDKKSIKILGNTFPKDIQDIIEAQKNNAIIEIFDIKIFFLGIGNFKLKGVLPITIQLEE